MINNYIIFPLIKQMRNNILVVYQFKINQQSLLSNFCNLLIDNH